jgi:hypothetical protein
MFTLLKNRERNCCVILIKSGFVRMYWCAKNKHGADNQQGFAQTILLPVIHGDNHKNARSRVPSTH